MSLECGIVGLPNVGKSTLFNTLTQAQVPAENFPFCTVDPHRGVVNVPDPRMQALANLVKPERIVPAIMTFVDIAGLVKGAASGEGLGNQFLSHIREVNAIAHVVRCFEDDNIIHVMGGVDPERDVEIIDLELCLSDLDSAKKRLERVEKTARSGQVDAKEEAEVLKKVMDDLGRGISVRRQSPAIQEKVKSLAFLTGKPLLYVANVSEDDLKAPSEKLKVWLKRLEEIAAKDNAPVVSMCIGLEQQLSQLDETDRQPFYDEYNIKEPVLHRFIREAYRLLGLITYFTAGVKEVRAWTIHRGDSAPQAAGAIHSDFQRGFIRAEVIAYDDYTKLGGEKPAREKGLQRSEGKEYIVQDGDVILFRFAV